MTIPDSSLEAEQSVLGALMIDPESNRNVIEQLTTEHFKWPEHHRLVTAIQHLASKSISIDQLTVSDYMESTPNGVDMVYINQLCEETKGITQGKVWSYFQILCEKMQRRRVLTAAQRIVDAATDITEIEGVSEAAQSALTGLFDKAAASTSTIDDATRRAVDEIQARFEREDGTLIGVPTGLTDLDRLTMGLQPGLIIVAARPGKGKTVLGMQMATATAKVGKDALVVSLEMEDQQLAERNISAMSGLYYSKIRDPKQITEDWEWNQLFDGAALSRELPIQFLERSETNIIKICSAIRAWHRTAKAPGVVVIDYLQLMEFKGNGNRTDLVGEATRKLKILSKELQLPIVLLSQLNRSLEQRPNKRPVNSDLRDSGSIEQDADAIFFIYRDEIYNPDTPYKGIAEILCGKGRGFEPKTVYAAAQLDRQRFMDLAPEWQPPEDVKPGRGRISGADL